MDFVEILNEGLTRQYRFSMARNEIDDLIEEKVDELQTKISRPGFRQGKVPKKIIRAQALGEMRSDAIKNAFEERVRKHFQETGDRSVGRPTFEDLVDETAEGGFSCVVSYELMPMTPDIDFSEIEVRKPVASDLEDQVQKMLEHFALIRGSFEETEDGYSARMGDKVVYDWNSAIEDQPHKNSEHKDAEIVLGGPKSESLIGGLLMRAKVGDVISSTMTLANDSQVYGDAAGRIANVEFTVKKIYRAVPKEINEQMASELGFTDLSEWRDAVGNMELERFRRESKGVVKIRLFDELEKRLDFDLPPHALEAETQSVFDALNVDKRETASTDDDSSAADEDQQQLWQDAKAIADRRMRIGFLIGDIARKQNFVECSDSELISHAIVNLWPSLTEAEIQENLVKNKQLYTHVWNDLIEHRATDFILALTKIIDEPITFNELRKLTSDQNTNDVKSETSEVASQNDTEQVAGQ